MTAGQQLRAVAALVVVLGGVLWLATRVLHDELTGVGVGSEAPSFMGKTLGEPAAQKTRDDFRGQVVLLNVWATWCGPCRVEMPSMEALHRALGPKGLHVVAISVDTASTDELRRFVRKNGFTFEVLHDSLGLVKAAYQTDAVPESFVLAADGTIRKKTIGASDWNSAPNRALIEELLREASERR